MITTIESDSLSVEVQTELERIISASCSSLIQRFLVPDQHTIMQIKQECLPAYRQLSQRLFDLELGAGKKYFMFFRIGVVANKPIFRVMMGEHLQKVTIKEFFFAGVDSLYDLYYKRSYESAVKTLKENVDITLMISKDFKTAVKSFDAQNAAFFGVELNIP